MSISPITMEDEVPPPFADRPDNQADLPLAVDEIDDVDEDVSEDMSDDSQNAKEGWKSWDEG